MSKPNIDPKDVAAVVSSTQGAPNPKADLLIELMSRQLQKQIEEEEEAHRVELAAQRANALNEEKGRQRLLAKQQGCSHLKPNNTTNLVGQWDGRGVTHFLCQDCQKHWVGGEVPVYLVPPESAIGGPTKLARTH
jgi:hypothetical protein